MDRISVLGRLSPYQGRRSVLVHRQEVEDIVKGILKCHNQYKGEYDKIAANFDTGNTRATAQKIWKFLKNNVRYEIESENKQMLKSPAAILQPGHTSDCKNFSLFAGGVLDAINRRGKKIDWCYRFASYNILSRTPQHVFVVINPGKDEIWLDAVLPTFDNRKQYFYKIDKRPKMSLISLAGVEIGKTKKESRQEFFKKLQAKIKQANKFVLKFSLPAQRGAILLVMRNNLWGVATHSKTALDKGHDKLLKFWEDIGGNRNTFKDVIEKGAKHKYVGAPFLTVNQSTKQQKFSAARSTSAASLPGGGYGGGEYSDGGGDMSGEQIGVIPVAAAAATATPFIVKIIDIFKKAGIKGSDIAEMAGKFKKAHDEKGKEVEKAINDEAEGRETKAGDEVLKGHNKGGGIPKVALIGGAALLGAYFLMRKRK